MKKIIITLMATLSILGNAQVSNGQFKAAANLNPTCSIESYPNLSFGDLTDKYISSNGTSGIGGNPLGPIVYKCTPYTVVTVNFGVGNVAKPGDDPESLNNIGEYVGQYGLLIGNKTQDKIMYRVALASKELSKIYETTHTLTFGKETTLTEMMGLLIVSKALPKPDTYIDNITITLSY